MAVVRAEARVDSGDDGAPVLAGETAQMNEVEAFHPRENVLDRVGAEAHGGRAVPGSLGGSLERGRVRIGHEHVEVDATGGGESREREGLGGGVRGAWAPGADSGAVRV